MDRRSFLTQAGVLAALSGITIRISGCSEESSPTGGGGNGADDVVGTVGANHGHTVRITRAEITAGGAVTLGLSVVSDGYYNTHAHSLSLSSEQVMEIGQGTRVQAPSSTNDLQDPHAHLVTFN